jgi:hypothetical protein
MPATEIPKDAFAEAIGKKLRIQGIPTLEFTNNHDHTVTMTMKLTFIVDADKVNETSTPKIITPDMGDVFVVEFGKPLSVDNPDEIHFSYNTVKTKLNIVAATPQIPKGNHG